MKKFFSIIFMSFAMLSHTSGAANNTTSQSSEIIIPESRNNIPPDRKRAPSRRLIHFVYNDAIGECNFILPYGVQYISVILESDAGIIYSGKIVADYPILKGYLDPGQYHIICNADDGSVYEGEIYL